MNSALDKAALNHTSLKVKARTSPVGKIVFNKIHGNTEINVVNSSVGFSQDQLQGFGEMIQVLQEEGKLGEAGSISISQLEIM
jgi:hypothetical protein